MVQILHLVYGSMIIEYHCLIVYFLECSSRPPTVFAIEPFKILCIAYSGGSASLVVIFCLPTFYREKVVRSNGACFPVIH